MIFFPTPNKTKKKKMAENFEAEDLNYYIDWLDNSITEEHIKYYEYSNFTNIQRIGKGSYGRVDRVNWKNSNRLFAIKSFDNDKQTLKEVVKEVLIFNCLIFQLNKILILYILFVLYVYYIYIYFVIVKIASKC